MNRQITPDAAAEPIKPNHESDHQPAGLTEPDHQPDKSLKIIGSTAYIQVAGIKKIPAKIDTGADSSSIWASEISINSRGELEFCLFAPASPLYTGERLTASDYKVQRVRNSTGDIHIRYRVALPAVIKGKKLRISFTLADRSRNNFPVLLGRKSLNKKFLVDVNQSAVKRPAPMDNTDLAAELAENPQKFHQKYMEKR